MVSMHGSSRFQYLFNTMYFMPTYLHLLTGGETVFLKALAGRSPRISQTTIFGDSDNLSGVECHIRSTEL